MSVVFEKGITVILPAYNEEACIEEAVTQCVEYLPTRFADHEVLVVDDGSQDGTADIVRRLGEAHPTVKLVRHGTNRGYGRAIATGFETASMPLVFFTDADCQFDIRELTDVAPLIEGQDAVLGFRVYRYDSVLRCFLSWSYNRLVRVLFLIPVRDVDCSFKLFTKEILERMPLESKDFFIDTEIVARLGKLRARIVEKGVRHYPRKAGHTTVRASHIPKTLWTLGRMWFRIHFGRKPEPVAVEARQAPSDADGR